ncbi:MAG: hypothetical protein IH851_01490 [Armatimonadetes bacterium]|nr:hypothetical protein [Armatimonadota bacterium]
MLIFAFSAFILLSAGAVPGSDTTPYFPVSEGTEWTYDLRAAGGSGELTQWITESRAVKNGWEVSVRTRAKMGDDAVVGAERLLVSGDEITRVAGPQGRLSPGLPILRAGARAGDSWKWSGTVTSLAGTASAEADVYVLQPESLKTPAGRFDAVRVQVHMRITGEDGVAELVKRYWFVKGVGWVRVETDMPAGRVTIVLRRFRAA